MLETMTLPSHSPTPTQTPATWTLASDPVAEAELQQQLRETRELESLSCCIDMPEDDADDATYDAQDTNEDADDDDAKLSTHTIVNVPHCPNILIMNNPTIPSNCETKSNNCQEKNSVRDQKNILVTSSCPQSNHVPFPLFCYFPSPLLKLIKPSQTRDKLRKKKERIPARKLLYYTKVSILLKGCRIFSPRNKVNNKLFLCEKQETFALSFSTEIKYFSFLIQIFYVRKWVTTDNAFTLASSILTLAGS